MPTSLGPAEILVILVVALIVLGPKRLPEAGRQVGRALAEIRHWSSSIQAEIKDALDTEPEPQPPPLAAAPPAPSPTPAPPPPVAPTPPPVAETPAKVLPPEWAAPPPSADS
jgi:sec-independent protein translocase protein TatA